VGKALVDVLVDDVGLIEDEVALDEDGHLPIGVHDIDVFGLVEEVYIADLEIHALLKEHKPTALAEGAGGAGVKNHHEGVSSKKFGQTPKGARPLHVNKPSVAALT
jgi:hypothetical protein